MGLNAAAVHFWFGAAYSMKTSINQTQVFFFLDQLIIGKFLEVISMNWGRDGNAAQVGVKGV